MALALRYAARSDIGLLREINEDSGYAGPRLLVVADGVGGAAAGEVASSVAVAIMSSLDEDSPGGDLLDQLSRSVRAANTYLRDMVKGEPDLEGMGTTLTVLLRSGSRFGLAHVGDSRAYLLRDGSLQQITRDHTFVQTLVDEGRITAEEADHHPQRNLITNSLDGREGMDLDLSVREARVGDRYLLCSDGLSNVVSEETLEETLDGAADPDAVAEALIELALRGGGPDNITAIVADVVDLDEAGRPSAVPVVVGAAAEGVSQRSGGSTAAAKAGALAPPPAEPGHLEEFEDDERSPRWGRRVLVLVVVLALLVGGGFAARSWARSQYYVGADGTGHVAIFRGLTQDVGPFETSSLYERENIALSDLQPFQRELVRSNLTADGLAGARHIVANLRDQATQCRHARVAATASPSPTRTTRTGKKKRAGATSTPSPAPSPSPSSDARVRRACGTSS
jgi:protein phosphatase